MMTMATRNEYIGTKLKQTNYYALSKKEKGKVLKEIVDTTELNKDYLTSKIAKMQFESKADKPRYKSHRNTKYDREVVSALEDVWEIFGKPCGQILEPLLKSDTLDITLNKIEKQYSFRVINLLRQISSKTIDNKLKDKKDKDKFNGKYENSKSDTLLKHKIPIKVSNEINSTEAGNMSTDLVESCGGSPFGPYISTFSSTDVSSGFWWGQAIPAATAQEIIKCLALRNKYIPFKVNSDHTDNGSPFINWDVEGWYELNNILHSRSRPNKKNDNCYVEQKNYTHVRKSIGNLRFCSISELEIINEILIRCANLRNYFIPTFKLTSKLRNGAKVHKQYKDIRTPFARIMADTTVPLEVKKQVIEIRNDLHPIQLSKEIKELQIKLYKIYKARNNQKVPKNMPAKSTNSLRFLTLRQRSFRLHD